MNSEIEYKSVEVVWEDSITDESGNEVVPIILKKSFTTLEEAKKFIDEKLTKIKYTIVLVV
ncbi:MAG: hypothetical protein KGZ42_07630 [Melioribacter sp.]|nr:hypothetical protein [Melioribacter sp.]